jgi:glucans biosynthesis protein
MQFEVNPMNQRIRERLANMRSAPRCNAKTRVGTPCQCPAMRGKTRCRLHGGLSSGAPRGADNGNYRDGYWTREAVEVRRWARELVRQFGNVGRH